MKFNYVPRFFVDKVLGKEFTVYRPEIPINISYNHKILPSEFLALLDSGADNNLFPWRYGLSIGINIRKGEKKEITGIGQNKIIAYRHKVIILISDQKIETDVDFCELQEIPLLGRDTFFKYFDKITFKQSKHIIYIKK